LSFFLICTFDSWKLFVFVFGDLQVHLHWFTWVWGFEG